MKNTGEGRERKRETDGGKELRRRGAQLLVTVTRHVMYDRIEERMEGRMKGGKDERREETEEGRESVKNMKIARRL